MTNNSKFQVLDQLYERLWWPSSFNVNTVEPYVFLSTFGERRGAFENWQPIRFFQFIVYLDEQALDGLVDRSLVHLSLLGRHGAVDEDLLLGRDLEIDVSLDAAKQEGRQDLVQGAQDVALLLLSNDPLLLRLGALVDVLGVEPGLEDSEVIENLAHQEVEERPELVEVILKRGAWKLSFTVNNAARIRSLWVRFPSLMMQNSETLGLRQLQVALLVPDDSLLHFLLLMKTFLVDIFHPR